MWPEKHTPASFSVPCVPHSFFMPRASAAGQSCGSCSSQPARGASFGTRVTIERGGESQVRLIVGEDEADPREGRIAWTGPLARALDGAEPGDEVELEAGGRQELLRVLTVEAGEP